MRLRSWLVGFALAATSVIVSTALRAGERGDAPTASPRIEGAWRLVSQKGAGAAKASKVPEGLEQIKLVTGGRFVWTLVRNGKVLAGAGGHYVLKGDRYTEHVDFVLSPSLESLVGQDIQFTAKLDDDTWNHVAVPRNKGEESPLVEVWERCK
jgi:hypothetical protein